MENKALVVIDLQNDITKNYKEIIEAVNRAIDWAVANDMTKAGYTVHVLTDCVTSYDKKKLDEMFAYYADKGCAVGQFREIMYCSTN